MPGAVFICRRGRAGRRPLCSVCKEREHDVLCDGKEPGATSTCDEPLCKRCALHAPKDRDYCPRHANQARLQRQFSFTKEGTDALGR